MLDVSMLKGRILEKISTMKGSYKDSALYMIQCMSNLNRRIQKLVTCISGETYNPNDGNWGLVGIFSRSKISQDLGTAPTQPSITESILIFMDILRG